MEIMGLNWRKVQNKQRSARKNKIPSIHNRTIHSCNKQLFQLIYFTFIYLSVYICLSFCFSIYQYIYPPISQTHCYCLSLTHTHNLSFSHTHTHTISLSQTHTPLKCVWTPIWRLWWIWAALCSFSFSLSHSLALSYTYTLSLSTHTHTS